MDQVGNMLLQANCTTGTLSTLHGPDCDTYWKIYLSGPGASAFPGKWVLNGNVHEELHGTVAYFDSLYSPSI